MPEYPSADENLPWLREVGSHEQQQAPAGHKIGLAAPAIALGLVIAAALAGAAILAPGSPVRTTTDPLRDPSTVPGRGEVAQGPPAAAPASPKPKRPPSASNRAVPKPPAAEQNANATRTHSEPPRAAVAKTQRLREHRARRRDVNTSAKYSSDGETIQLAAYAKAPAAHAGWTRLRKAHRELQTLHEHVISARVGSRKVYRLRASGPDAGRICTALQKAGSACALVRD